ncbi:MAG TPA: DUF4126 domain-containing protein [Thermoleophilaceae bacterium]|nr:DUF4126 domain-containing protein [Thermoleophilaceae bacterium]
MDIGTGAGLAGSVGVRPFLPPLLTGALARGDIGIDFDGTDWSFLESPVFLFAVLVLAVAWYMAERSGANRRVMGRAGLLLSVTLGALLFAGALAGGGHSGIPGLVAGVACAALAYVAIFALLSRAARRLNGEAAGFLTLYADAAALVLATVAIFVPPVSFLALIAFALVLVRGRAAADRKYAGLRILR